jgi:hypothetical protein
MADSNRETSLLIYRFASHARARNDKSESPELAFFPFWSAAVLCSAALVFCVFGSVFSHVTAKTRKTKKQEKPKRQSKALPHSKKEQKAS